MDNAASMANPRKHLRIGAFQPPQGLANDFALAFYQRAQQDVGFIFALA
jgi:hypothetical protein